MSSNANLTSGITAFLTVAGVDLVLRDHGNQTRCRVDYSSMAGTLNNEPVSVEFTDDDDLISVELGDRTFGLKLQKAGHYFSYLEPLPPKADAADISEARRLFRQAQKAKAKK